MRKEDLLLLHFRLWNRLLIKIAISLNRLRKHTSGGAAGAWRALVLLGHFVGYSRDGISGTGMLHTFY